MRPFMDENFLLSTPTAVKLYREHASKMPILDYHCHLSPKEIWEDRVFENMTQIWLESDHYKWRLMRAHGIPESHITGDAPDREKFQAWAETVSMAIGSPLFHWTHLELREFFGWDKVLSGKTAQECWDFCNAKLPGMSARKLIEKAGVTHLCTTDDPADDLRWHKLLKEDETFSVQVLPAWRPDKVLSINKPDFCEYLKQLGTAADTKITGLDTLLEVLKKRMDFFSDNGCCVSDHGMDRVPGCIATREEADRILKTRLAGEKISSREEEGYRAYILDALGKEYARRGWVMQLHLGVIRDLNTAVFDRLGSDAGIDSIGVRVEPKALADLLDRLACENALPKTVIYSLEPGDNTALDTVIACFQGRGKGWVQHGAAWWFNDHKQGMVQQLTSVGNNGMLADFVGMLTDSRSFLSYARHDYFRRILCDLIGKWVEDGEYPDDQDLLKEIVEGICYKNALSYFGFEVPDHDKE